MKGRDRYIRLFVEESRELLAGLSGSLQELQDGRPDALRHLFRQAHSVKGMAASLGLLEVEALSHAMEEGFDVLRREGSPPPDDLMDLLWRGGDALSDAVEEVAAGREEPMLSDLARQVRERFAAPARSEDRPGEPPAGAVSAAGGDDTAGRAEARPVLEVLVRIDDAETMPRARARVALKRLERLGRVQEGGAAQESGGRVLCRRLATDLPASRVTAALEGLVGVSQVEVGGPARERSDGPEGRSDSMRVAAGQMDLLLEEATELLVHHARLERLAEESGAPELGLRLEGLWRTSRAILDRLLRVRMLPFRSIVPALERSMRDLCRRLGKQATLTVEGEDVRLDRAVLEQLTDTLTHLMRNALDHGIEDPEAREEAGKERSGRIHIGLERASDTVLLRLSDDGAGMDPDALRRKAVKNGALDDAAAALLTDTDALLLATLPGVTTASATTEISGRGVGLDVVRSRVEALGGGIDLSAERGRGTRIVLRLPPSVTVLTAFLVRTGPDLWAVPVRKVEETVPVETVSAQDPQVPWRGRMVKAYSLGEAMGSTVEGAPAGSTAIIHYRGGDLAAAVVDEVEARRELLVKPLLGPLEALGEVIGAAVTGDGEVTPVLDLDRIEPPRELRILERSA